MKKRIILFALTLVLVICAFAFTVSAATADISKGVAKYDTEKALYDTNGNALTWYINADSQTVYDLTKNVISLSSNGTMTYKSDVVPNAHSVIIANFKNADGSDVTVDGASVVYFSHEMFWKSANLSHVYIPSSLESLSSRTGDPRNTFRECPNLAQVWFPEDSKVTVFGRFTFAKSGLIEVNIPKNVEIMEMGENGSWSIFGVCKRLTTVKFAKDSKLTYLPDQCFTGCTSLEEIELPNSIQYAYQRIFQGCSSLKTIKLGYNFAYNANSANDHNSFTYGANSLKEVYISANYYKNAPANLYWVSYVFNGGGNVKYFYTGSASDFAITLENFKNSTTKATEENINFLNATVITKAEYDSSPESYQDKDYIIVDCNPCEIFFDGKHTTGTPKCTRCNTEIYCEDETHNLEIAITYENFGKDGVKTVRCLDCNSSVITKVAPKLFDCKGYSMPLDGDDEFSISFEINQKAIDEYQEITNTKINYGIFAVAESKIGSNDILLSDGSANENVIKAEVNLDKLISFELRLHGFKTEVQKTALLVLGAYVGVTDKDNNTVYSYIQDSDPQENEKYHTISFNKVLNAPEN